MRRRDNEIERARRYSRALVDASQMLRQPAPQRGGAPGVRVRWRAHAPLWFSTSGSRS